MNQKEAVEIAEMKKDIKYIGTKLDVHIQEGKDDSKENKLQQDKILKKLDDHMEFINTAISKKADKSSVEGLWKRMDKINYKIAYASGAVGIIVLILTLILRR